MSKPLLVVEGVDDKHALRHLLIRHGLPDVDWETRPELPRLVDAGGDANITARRPVEGDTAGMLLEGMEARIRRATGATIGFVLDADEDCDAEARWASVCTRLTTTGAEHPRRLQPGGYIGESATYQARVGVWIMPNNRDIGGLEAFLRTLVAEGNPLISHAEASTDEAKKLGAEFSEAHQSKAVLHAWLAWQSRPGCPYGTAIRALYFRHNSPAADAFVAWFRKLYNL